AVVRQPLPSAASSSGRATSLSSPGAIRPCERARPATFSPLPAASFPFVSSVPPGLQDARSARTRVCDPPDFAAAIVTHEKRAISEHEHTDRTSPYVAAALVSHPAGDEIIVAAGRVPVVERNADDFVSSPQSSIPGAMKGHERAAAIFGWEHRAFVERDAEGGGVGLDEQSGRDRLAHEIGPLSTPARVLMRSDEGVRPAIERA